MPPRPAVILVVALLGGCSFVAVTPAPRTLTPGRTPRCSAWSSAPVGDLLVAVPAAALLVASVAGWAGQEGDPEGHNFDSRSLYLGFSIPTAGLFGLSAWYGLSETRRCRALQRAAGPSDE